MRYDTASLILLPFLSFVDNFNMGFADVEYETREEAQLALDGWNGGQLDGEVVEVMFAKKVAKPVQPARPVRSRVPLSPPRRGGRARSPPRRRNEGTCSY